MYVVRIDILNSFMREHAQARGPLKVWLAEAKAAQWEHWSDIKSRYPSADLISGRSNGYRVVFNIKGKYYRLAVLVYFNQQRVVIERVGTHAEYDNWKL